MILKEDKALLDEVVLLLKDRGLSFFFAVFLSSIIPLRRVLSAVLDVLNPLLSILISQSKLVNFQRAIESQAGFEYFIKELEK